MLVKIEKNGKVEFLNLYSDEIAKFIRENKLKTETGSGVWTSEYENISLSVMVFEDGTLNINGMYIWYDEEAMEHLTKNYGYLEKELDAMCKFSCSLPTNEEFNNALYDYLYN